MCTSIGTSGFKWGTRDYLGPARGLEGPERYTGLFSEITKKENVTQNF